MRVSKASLRTGLVAAAGVLSIAVVLGVAAPARAEPPVDLSTSSQVTDDAGVLGERTADVEDALASLREEQKVQLFVVFVDSFDGMNAQQWADETAQRNGLGLNDVVLAVAVGDRQYAYSVAEGFPLTNEQLADIAVGQIEPSLQQDDWAAASIAAAQGYAAALSAEPGEPDAEAAAGEDAGGGTSWWTCLFWAAVVAAVVAGISIGLRGRSRSRTREGHAGATSPVELSTEELTRRASALLVEVDDAIKTSEQEVSFAEAEFSPASAAAFRQAVEAARADLAEAFRVQQHLVDATPEDEETRRAMLQEIIQRTERADAALDEHARAFDELRDRAARAGDILAAARAELERVDASLPEATPMLASLRARYPETALASVADNVQQAAERLAFARTALDEGEVALAAEDRNQAALATLGAEEAIAQADTLIREIFSARSDLEQAATGLEAERSELSRDVPEAEAVVASAATPPAALSAALAAAKQTAATVDAEQEKGPIDPHAAFRMLDEASTRLDDALAAFRDDQARVQRAGAMIEQMLGSADSRVRAVSEYITTRRGAVGPDARTRLAEAQRHLSQAYGLREADPQSALADAQRAIALADEAGSLAQADVEDYQRTPYPGTATPPSFPGGGGGGLGNLVLGGLILDSVLRSAGGGYRHSTPSLGGLTLGGFGGSAMRRGGGGRF